MFFGWVLVGFKYFSFDLDEKVLRQFIDSCVVAVQLVNYR